MPLKTIVGLGGLIRAVHSAALVLLVDQMDEMIELGKLDAHPSEQFRSAANALIDIIEALPNAVVVIGCIEDSYQRFGQPPYRGRSSIAWSATRNRSGWRATARWTRCGAIAARRLEALFDAVSAPVSAPADPTNPVAPYTAADLGAAPQPGALDKLGGQAAGEFYLATEREVAPVRAARSLIATAQLPEERVRELAAAR